MNVNTRRYIFVDFENLKKVKIKKLKKVCDRVFVFINAAEKSIPFTLVREMQRFGKAAKWVPIIEPFDENMNYHLCFLMGKLHQKESRDIEFAILSNDPEYDPLVQFINAEGRSCLRVKRKRTRDERVDEFYEEDDFVDVDDVVEENYDDPMPGESELDELDGYAPGSDNNNDVVHVTATETKNRLLHSGNRPGDVPMLRSFIRLYNQELSERDNVDMIIKRMQETKDIEIKNNKQVVYNF